MNEQSQFKVGQQVEVYYTQFNKMIGVISRIEGNQHVRLYHIIFENGLSCTRRANEITLVSDPTEPDPERDNSQAIQDLTAELNALCAAMEATPKAGQVVTIKATGGKAQVVETLSGKLQYRVVDSNGDKVFVNGALLDLAISEVA